MSRAVLNTATQQVLMLFSIHISTKQGFCGLSESLQIHAVIVDSPQTLSNYLYTLHVLLKFMYLGFQLVVGFILSSG